MPGRDGGKAKPLKKPKAKGNDDEDEDDKAFKAKQKADAAAIKDMQAKASGARELYRPSMLCECDKGDSPSRDTALFRS
ncbi:hypothetical protein CYMTET_29093 [Cymbomonas tetramitiformis]|uniref:Translation machinery associated TMA7 n=1 Tax=Cymbomonas tetramitiformis TaxID=36881 RepID=A0AAE0FLN2_9CHLO|nr:hypothetical protein CYMTET_29093 [Cymbomonas tetramitiformis]